MRDLSINVDQGACFCTQAGRCTAWQLPVQYMEWSEATASLWLPFIECKMTITTKFKY